MSNIKVNATELVKTLDIIPADQNIMLIGNHGIGKSEILTEYYAAKNIKVITLFLGQMSDPGDIIGLPDKNATSQKTEFLPPYWFPLDNEPIVLFLDELNRARPEVLQTIMDLTLNRKLTGKTLPEGSRIISAVNEGDRYQLTDLDPALVSRFNIMEFRPTVQEWLLWANRKGCDGRVISFIKENPIWLDRDPDMKENEDTGLTKYPDRRAWKRVSDIITGVSELEKVHTKAISSIVGQKAASAFCNSISFRRLIGGREILFNFEKCLDTLEGYQLHEMSVTNDSVYRVLDTERFDKSEKELICKNLDAYFNFLTKRKKEAAAHFSNLYISQTYPKAMDFIATECSVLTMAMVIYVKGIK